MITFNIPQSQPEYGFVEFANHVLNYSPVYEMRSQMRLGYKAIESIESAVKSGSSSVSMEDDVGKLFKHATENTPIPKLFYSLVEGKIGDQVPKTFFTKFYEAAENGCAV